MENPILLCVKAEKNSKIFKMAPKFKMADTLSCQMTQYPFRAQELIPLDFDFMVPKHQFPTRWTSEKW